MDKWDIYSLVCLHSLVSEYPLLKSDLKTPVWLVGNTEKTKSAKSCHLLISWLVKTYIACHFIVLFLVNTTRYTVNGLLEWLYGTCHSGTSAWREPCWAIYLKLTCLQQASGIKTHLVEFEVNSIILYWVPSIATLQHVLRTSWALATMPHHPHQSMIWGLWVSGYDLLQHTTHRLHGSLSWSLHRTPGQTNAEKHWEVLR